MDEVFSIKNGSIKAFEAAYHHWSGRIYLFILRQCNSEAIAEDVVQQVFVRLWEKREHLSVDFSLSTQLFRMSRTIFIDELRKTAQSRKYQEYQQGKEAFTEDTLEHKEALKIVYSAIEQMPPVRKRIFLMSRMEHLTYGQIAERLSISPKTVENHIALALRYLRGFTPLLIVVQIL
ncbi:MAG: RNA polymerase sigma-70 factor [Pedobacter sp.]|uniref:RNA polymerase sigma-70 factor n=1 Tax=Pedobacter sp. TaxID=1411316 RepID=UPI00339AC1FA